jgi:hypothetical protein
MALSNVLGTLLRHDTRNLTAQVNPLKDLLGISIY